MVILLTLVFPLRLLLLLTMMLPPLPREGEEGVLVLPREGEAQALVKTLQWLLPVPLILVSSLLEAETLVELQMLLPRLLPRLLPLLLERQEVVALLAVRHCLQLGLLLLIRLVLPPYQKTVISFAI